MTINQDNSSRIDYYLSPERDFSNINSAHFRYLICSSPRCGSTLLGQMLNDTGLMGDPLEYFNPIYLNAYFKRFKIEEDSVENIISRLEKIRTSPNGNFGLQIHFRHFMKIFGSPEAPSAINFIKRFDRILLVRRRDRISQATSLYRARMTGIWSSLENDFRLRKDFIPLNTPHVPFDPARLSESLHGVIMQDMGWVQLFERNKIPHLEIYYEDLIANWQNACSGIMSYLGTTLSEKDVPHQKLRKQSDGHDPLREQFLRYTGAESR